MGDNCCDNLPCMGYVNPDQKDVNLPCTDDCCDLPCPRDRNPGYIGELTECCESSSECCNDNVKCYYVNGKCREGDYYKSKDKCCYETETCDSSTSRYQKCDDSSSQYHYNKKGEKSSYKEIKFSFCSHKKHKLSKYIKSSCAVCYNGKAGALIHLYEGKTYKFTVEKSSDPKKGVMITDLPSGGKNAIPVYGACMNGSSFIMTVSKEMCMRHQILYYQMCGYENAGGAIVFHRNKC